MSGTTPLEVRHNQEISPNAMDRAEIISDDITTETPAGTFKHCIRIEETSGLDPDEKCYTTYAPGVGPIQDEDLLLTGYGWIQEVSISLRDVPRPVRSTIRKHVDGSKIIEIEKTMIAGSVVCEAEIVRNDKEFDILVSAEGKFLGVEEEEGTEDDEIAEDDKESDDG